MNIAAYFFTLALLYLLASDASAADYYVTKAGSGTTCSQASPCLTIAIGISKLASGDRLFIGAGTYNEHVNAALIPNGTNDANRTRVHSIPGQQVIIMPSSVSGTSVVDFGNSLVKNWIEFNGGQNCGPSSGGATCNMILDGTNVVSPDESNTSNNTYFGISTNIRFTNLELRNTGVAGGTTGNPENGFQGGGSNIEISNCNVHDNGKKASATWTAGAYGWYISGGSGHVVDNCLVHRNGGYGLHAYHSSNPADITGFVIKNSAIYDNGQAAVTVGIANVLLGSCTGCMIYNSVVRDMAHNNGGGIEIGHSCTGCSVYNNTIVRNKRYGIMTTASTSGTLIRNNIVKDNDLGGIGFPNIENNGSGSTISNNLCHGTGGTTNCSLTSDPLFVDMANNNFHLLVSSPAIDAGFALNAIFTTDIEATTRPQGKAYDLGAYEFAAPPACPASSGLVAQYGFDGVDTDSSGNGFTATPGSGWSYVTGKYGQGRQTTGASGITVADATKLDFCNGFTLALWVSVPSVSTDVMFIVKNPNSKYFLGQLANTCGATVNPLGGYSQGSLQSACYATPLTTATMTYLAVTYDGTNLRLYKDGSLLTTQAGGTVLDATTGTLQFCTSGFSETCPSGTIIDEIRLYDVARTSTEIVSDMNTPIVPLTAPTLKVSGTMKLGAGSAALKLPGGS